MLVRRSATCATLFCLLGLSACQTTSPGAGAQRDGYSSLAERDYAQAKASFEKAAALSTTVPEKARAYLGLGNVALQKGDAKEALQSFYEAKRVLGDSTVSGSDPVVREVNHAMGLAYFTLGDYSLAQRYLTKGLEGCPEDERETTLARLVVCCRSIGDAKDAASCRAQLKQPLSPEVERILSLQPRPRSEAFAQDHEPALDESIGRAAETTPPPTATSPLSRGDSRISVLTRADWAARSTGKNINRMGRIDKITVHHTGGPSFWGNTLAEAATEIRNIQKYHQDERGWADIGYHYIVDRRGNVWQGRRLYYQGAHARGFLNEGNIGIALLGNFCNQRPTRAQYESLALLVEKLCAHFQLSSRQVFTHRELAEERTSCPGPALSGCVRTIRSHLDRRLVAYRPSSAAAR